MNASIQCENLSKSYQKGGQTITPLEALNLHVAAGEFLALMGPSGSGKTTLLNLIAALDHPSSGSIRVGEHDIGSFSRAEAAAWRARSVGIIFQLYHLVPVLSAWENVELPLLAGSRPRHERRKRVDSALRLVGLTDRAHHRPTEMSGGQEQRVAIARAIVADPALIVADEPTGDLDRESADSILDLLASVSAEFGKTVVMVTHDARAAARADRTLHLEKGRLVEATDKA